MGIENNTREIEVQNQELQRANREQIEQANKEHEELGKVLDGLDTLDNEAELDEISGNEDISKQDDAASQLDNNDKIEDETSEQFETINNPVYNEVENNGFGINDVNQAVDAKEAYEAEIRDMSQDEYHDQKELDQRVEENGSEPNMTEPSVLGNDLHQGDVSNKETDNRSRLNEPEQNAVDKERPTEETPGNGESEEDSLDDNDSIEENGLEDEVPNTVKPDDFVAKDINDDTDNFEDSESEVSNELKESLKTFEQNEWDNLNTDEKKKAVDDLRNSVAEDLGLSEKPNIRYYNNEDGGDFGGCSPSENAIYLNEYNMGDASETADTIAHESRRCWQRELSENSDSPQGQVFKENFDDYIRPEEDYRGYRNQPVETDAREYARDITGSIPTEGKNEIDDSITETTNPNVAQNNMRQNEERIGSLVEKPVDFESKREVSLQEKIDVSNQNIKDINENPTLGDLEKAQEIVGVLKDLGFDKVDISTVEAFTDRDIQVVNLNGLQTLYRRSWDTEGSEEYGYGSWWSDHPMSIEEARDGLAILETWGNPLTGKYEANPTDTLALEGTAAPQKHEASGEYRSGGEKQYFIDKPEKGYCRKVD